MRRLFFSATILLLMSGCNKSTSSGPSGSLPLANSLIGSWGLVKSDSTAFPSGTVWIFQDTTLTITMGNVAIGGSFTYDDNPNPKTIDIKLQGATHNPNLAIYKFDDSSHLILKLMNGAQNRATTFSVESYYILEEFVKQ